MRRHPPVDRERLRPCPACRRPALATPRYSTQVCDDCRVHAVCIDGRRVRGFNTSLGGGFVATHVDDDSTCDQVTLDGRCWVADRPCEMGEAKLGGVVVSMR